MKVTDECRKHQDVISCVRMANHVMVVAFLLNGRHNFAVTEGVEGVSAGTRHEN
jgi:hypothetical protein